MLQIDKQSETTAKNLAKSQNHSKNKLCRMPPQYAPMPLPSKWWLKSHPDHLSVCPSGDS